MSNTRLQYYNLFSVPNIHLMRIGKRSFGWSAPTLWNSLHKTLRLIKSHHEFIKLRRFVVVNLINLYVYLFYLYIYIYIYQFIYI